MPNDKTPILIGSGLTVQKEKDASKGQIAAGAAGRGSDNRDYRRGAG